MKTVLIIEDDDIQRELLFSRCSRMGLQPLGATSAEEAQIIRKAERVDLHLVDIGLPGKKSGIDYVRDLRDEGIEDPVIILTGKDTGSNILSSQKLGVSHFLVKPSTSEEFTSIVEKAILDKLAEFTYVKPDESDGSMKYMLTIPSKQGTAYIESASFHHPEETEEYARHVVCISTQIGCNFCGFCMNSSICIPRESLSLKDLELQVEVAENFHKFRKLPRTLLFGGGGEPTLNPAVSELIESTGDNTMVRIVTVGIKKPFERFVERFGGCPRIIQIQISVHFPDDEMRKLHIRIAKANPLEEILEIARLYAEKSGQLVCLNFVLFRGINDDKQTIEKMADLAKTGPFWVRLSYDNPFGIYRPASEKSYLLAEDIFQTRDVPYKRFISKGRRIGAGCGHLVAMIHRNISKRGRMN